MNPYLLLTLIGSIASIVSALLMAKTDSIFIHIAYAIILTISAGWSMFHIGKIKKQLEESEIRRKYYESLSEEAKNILNNFPDSINTVAYYRGFILTSFAFLEKSKNEFSETYTLAKKIVNGLKITEITSDVDFGQQKSIMYEGAIAMKSMLEGIKKNINAH